MNIGERESRIGDFKFTVSPETEIQRKGFLGIGRKERQTMSITITDTSKDAKITLKVSGVNQERVTLAASVVLRKIKEQADLDGKIDISQIRIHASDLPEQMGDDKERSEIAQIVHNMVVKYVNVHQKFMETIEKPNFPYRPIGYKLEKAAKNPTKQIALKTSDFSVKFFEDDLKILNKKFDPKNKLQQEAWGRFYAKMRVVAQEKAQGPDGQERVKYLLKNKEIQKILNKGIEIFGKFEFLGDAYASNEVVKTFKQVQVVQGATKAKAQTPSQPVPSFGLPPPLPQAGAPPRPVPPPPLPPSPQPESQALQPTAGGAAAAPASEQKKGLSVEAQRELSVRLMKELEFMNKYVKALEEYAKGVSNNDKEYINKLKDMLTDFGRLEVEFPKNPEKYIQKIITYMTPDFLEYLTNLVASKDSAKKEIINNTGGDVIDVALVAKANKHASKISPIIADVPLEYMPVLIFGKVKTVLETLQKKCDAIYGEENSPELNQILQNVNKILDAANAIPEALILFNQDALTIINDSDKNKSIKQREKDIAVLFKGACKKYPHLKGSLGVAYREALACCNKILHENEYRARYRLPPNPASIPVPKYIQQPVVQFNEVALEILGYSRTSEKAKEMNKEKELLKLFNNACKANPQLKEPLKIAYEEALACCRGVLRKDEYKARYLQHDL